jgi:hypothetical protein
MKCPVLFRVVFFGSLNKPNELFRSVGLNYILDIQIFYSTAADIPLLGGKFSLCNITPRREFMYL